MIRIKYKKDKLGVKAGPFLISATLLINIEINNEGELVMRNGDTVVYCEVCSNMRNAKYRARKRLEELGYPVLTEMRNRRKK